jgi:hypothetical protein
MRLFSLLLVIFLFLSSSAFGQGPPQPDISPKKGDITKNIHIVFDKSGSMNYSDFEKGYAEVEKIIMQNSDEFNMAVTVFANGHIRMPARDKDCSLGKNWLAMPSAIHYMNVMKWIRSNGPDNGSTNIRSAVKDILKENKERVTIIIISDCIIDDISDALNDIRVAVAAKGKDKRHPIKIGFINVNEYMPNDTYKDMVKSKCWYICLGRKKKRKVY